MWCGLAHNGRVDDDLAERVRAFCDAWDADADDTAELFLSRSTWDALNALRAAVGVGPAAGSESDDTEVCVSPVDGGTVAWSVEGPTVHVEVIEVDRSR